ncbi:L,D-transpeptidase family protein [Candidatus Kaiserbacteria bacterium]|nr:L,D-transpeptidase family protein [Candidatus Kaiserbacteria bacterium]
MKKVDSIDRNIIISLSFIIIILLGLIIFISYQRSYYFVENTNEGLVEEEKKFLHQEEVVIVKSASSTAEDIILPIDKVLFEYVEVIDGCGIHFEGECLNVRSGPGTEFPVVAQLRNHVVLKVGGKVDNEGMVWYKIVFDEWLRYPDRLSGDWYVASDFVSILQDEGDRTVWEHEYSTTTKKSITVDRSEQKLYAFEGDAMFLELDISTGLELTPTPRGTFKIFKKTPSRYMQGPLPHLVDQSYYDLPGVPWNLYFTEGGAVIHGAYWHDSFGSRYSHGCVNVEPGSAKKLYQWADLGTTVIVKD